MTPHSRQPKRRRPHHHASSCLVALVTAIALSTTAFAHNAKQAKAPAAATAARNKAEIVQLERNWLHALQTHNVSEIDRILAPDLVRPAPGSGTFITKSEMLAYLRTHPGPRAQGAHFQQMNVTLYGSIAIARGILTTTNPQGKVVRKTLFTDVFVRRDGRWQAVSAQENNVPQPPRTAKTSH